MSLQNRLYELRTEAKMTQEAFAEALGVSPQAVQKWESGASAPTLTKIILISKKFGVSIDALVLDRDSRNAEELASKSIYPNYDNMEIWETYSDELMTEYRQSYEEGLDVAAYEELFKAVGKLPKDKYKEALADVLFDIVLNGKTRPDYKYQEPSDLDGIKVLRKTYAFSKKEIPMSALKDKIHGAWLGRVCGCLLGKPVECIKSPELHALLRASDNFPMRRYIKRTDITDEIVKNSNFPFLAQPWVHCYADIVDGMPSDDDTNYLVMAQELIKKYGRDFTAYDMSRMWLESQSKSAYCTAERVAFCNFIKGYEPPQSALYKNKYREWIGAQIRGDYFGYINPGNPELAAEMAFRDASISHVKNGIYGEMFIAAMLACAAVTDDIKDIIRGGLAEIPATSRLYEAIEKVLSDYDDGVPQEACFQNIHTLYNEYDTHDWTHTISNAMIVAAALLYGGGDYGKSICMAVETGFDTDCNGATVGSILGMRNGTSGIGEEWTKPVNDKLHTTLFGVGTVSIKERAELTMEHLEK